MSTNQLHGKKIEDIIKSVYPGSSDNNRSVHSDFDIESIFDKDYNIPTDIKTSKISKCLKVDLADARKKFIRDCDFRWLFVFYDQMNDIKSIKYIYEYIIDRSSYLKIKGNIPYSEIEDFHNSISKNNICDFKDARKFAKSKKKELNEKYNSLIELNPKIDSKNQRRLQCSIKIEFINYIVMPIIYDKEYRDICLPFNIKSSSREFDFDD